MFPSNGVASIPFVELHDNNESLEDHYDVRFVSLSADVLGQGFGLHLEFPECLDMCHGLSDQCSVAVDFVGVKRAPSSNNVVIDGFHGLLTLGQLIPECRLLIRN